DVVFGGACNQLQDAGECVQRHDERMVAGGLKRIVHVEEESASGMDHRGGLPEHEPVSAHHLPAEHLPDALVPEADSQNGNFPGEPLDDSTADPGVARASRARLDHDGLGVPPHGVLDGDLVVPDHVRGTAQLAQILDEVPGEGVVVVDHEDHESNPRDARRTASSTARPLFRVSSHSSSGSESATIPAPTPQWILPRSKVAVRIAMQKAAFPWKSK